MAPQPGAERGPALPQDDGAGGQAHVDGVDPLQGVNEGERQVQVAEPGLDGEAGGGRGQGEDCDSHAGLVYNWRQENSRNRRRI